MKIYQEIDSLHLTYYLFRLIFFFKLTLFENNKYKERSEVKANLKQDIKIDNSSKRQISDHNKVPDLLILNFYIIYINKIQCRSVCLSFCLTFCVFHSGDFIFKAICKFFLSFRASAWEFLGQTDFEYLK